MTVKNVLSMKPPAAVQLRVAARVADDDLLKCKILARLR
jgi:hypothetical protein